MKDILLSDVRPPRRIEFHNGFDTAKRCALISATFRVDGSANTVRHHAAKESHLRRFFPRYRARISYAADDDDHAAIISVTCSRWLSDDA